MLGWHLRLSKIQPFQRPVMSGGKIHLHLLLLTFKIIKNHHHHQRTVHFLPRLIKGMDGCFSTALGRQSTFSNILDLLFSHSGDCEIWHAIWILTISSGFEMATVVKGLEFLGASSGPDHTDQLEKGYVGNIVRCF